MQESNPPFRPILSVALVVNTDDHERLQHALIDLALQIPAFNVATDRQTEACVIRGSSELHLRSICEQLSRQFLIYIRVGEPQVVFVETIRKASEAEGKYIRQTGGKGNYGHAKIRLEPNETGKGVEFINEIKGGSIPKEYIKPIEHGIREAALGGILAGYELVDFKAIL